MAIIAIAAMLAAGCNSSSDTPAPTETAEETSTAAPAPSPEAPEPAPEPDAEPAPDLEYGDGSFGDTPLPPGSVVSIGDASGPTWDIQVLDVDWNYTQADFAPSTAGTYAALTLEVTNTSADPQDPYLTIYWDFGDGNEQQFEESMQAADEDLVKIESMAPGETATGVIVFEVPAGMSQGVIGFYAYGEPGTWVAVE